jgi:cyclophilin family peptidyl-prolyl cis-trans isomerase
MVSRLRVSPAAALAVAVACTPGEQANDSLGASQAAGVSPDPHPVVVLETNKGTIVMELDRENAPETVDNFLLHVRSNFYDGLTFHRVRPGFMIQAGSLTADAKRRESSVFPIANEAENGHANVRGAVAMARTGDPHSATSEFFINVVDNPKLDFTERTPQGWGYAVFGRVVEGMDVVDIITAVPTERRGRYEAVPLEPVVIARAYVREGAS